MKTMRLWCCCSEFENFLWLFWQVAATHKRQISHLNTSSKGLSELQVDSTLLFPSTLSSLRHFLFVASSLSSFIYQRLLSRRHIYLLYHLSTPPSFEPFIRFHSSAHLLFESWRRFNSLPVLILHFVASPTLISELSNPLAVITHFIQEVCCCLAPLFYFALPLLSLSNYNFVFQCHKDSESLFSLTSWRYRDKSIYSTTHDIFNANPSRKGQYRQSMLLSLHLITSTIHLSYFLCLPLIHPPSSVLYRHYSSQLHIFHFLHWVFNISSLYPGIHFIQSLCHLLSSLL